MPKLIPDALKARAIALRCDERLGLDDIHRRLKGRISVGTLSKLLRAYPLADAELRDRCALGACLVNAVRPAYTPTVSPKTARFVARRPAKGYRQRLSIAAVQERLAARGYFAEVVGPTIGTMLVYGAGRTPVRLRVRSTYRIPGEGRPVTKTQTERGVRFTKDDCDGVVGYDLETDTAFVYPIEECGGSQRSCQPDDAEAWHRLGLTAAAQGSDAGRAKRPRPSRH